MYLVYFRSIDEAYAAGGTIRFITDQGVPVTMHVVL